MYTTHLFFFVTGWRGFLTGTRRAWHSHHRFGLEGHREGQLVVNRGVHARGLRRFVDLATGVLARGGRVWGFGLGRVGQRHPWGFNFGHWFPGDFSNSFLVRRRPRRRIRPPRRRPKTRLHRRWSKRARFCPTRSQLLLKAYLDRVVLPVKTYRLGGPSGGPARARWARHWWIPRGSPPGRFPPSSPRFSLLGRRDTPCFARAVRHRRRWRSTRPAQPGPSRFVPGIPPGWPTASLPFRRDPLPSRRRRRHRMISRPTVRLRPRCRSGFLFPSLVVGGGFKSSRMSLFVEAHHSGVPFVFFGGADSRPYLTSFLVLWNQHPTSLEGVTFLLDDLARLAHREGLFRVLWSRLRKPF